MLKEFLEALSRQAVRASAPVKLDVPDPRRTVYVIDGTAVGFDVPPPPRDHKPGSLTDVVALANRFHASTSVPFDPVVWYDRDAVSLVIDDDTDSDHHRVERATLTLERSDVFDVLVGLRSNQAGAWMDQKSFIRLLRIRLAGALRPEALLNTVRKVRFENGVTTSLERRNQRESLGKEITAKVEAETELPAEVTLSVPVYKTPGETDRHPCRCTVEVDPAEGTFRLLPLPDEIERVVDLAMGSISARLAAGLDDDVPYYFGKP